MKITPGQNIIKLLKTSFKIMSQKQLGRKSHITDRKTKIGTTADFSVQRMQKPEDTGATQHLSKGHTHTQMLHHAKNTSFKNKGEIEMFSGIQKRKYPSPADLH